MRVETSGRVFGLDGQAWLRGFVVSKYRSGSGNCVLHSLGQLGQPVQMGLFRRDITQTRIRPSRVVSVKILGNVGASGADAVVRLQIHPLVLHAAPHEGMFQMQLVDPARPVVHRASADAQTRKQQNNGTVYTPDYPRLSDI